MNNIEFKNQNGKTDNILLNNFMISEGFGLRVGLLFIILGILWMGKQIGWFEQGLLGPFVMLTLGVWFLCFYFIRRIDLKINNWISSLDLSERDYYGF